MKIRISLLVAIAVSFFSFISCDFTKDEESRNDTPGVLCKNLTITGKSYSETEDLIQKVKEEFGSDYTIADWNDLEAVNDIDEWISCMGLKDEQWFYVTKNGSFLYNSNRQYFVGYYESGSAPSNWLVHASINNKLFLGSWFGLDQSILTKKE